MGTETILTDQKSVFEFAFHPFSTFRPFIISKIGESCIYILYPIFASRMCARAEPFYETPIKSGFSRVLGFTPYTFASTSPVRQINRADPRRGAGDRCRPLRGRRERLTERPQGSAHRGGFAPRVRCYGGGGEMGLRARCAAKN